MRPALNIHRATGRPAVLVLIPDQLQVDPELRIRLDQVRPDASPLFQWALDRPQTFLHTELAPDGVVLIDLAPALRQAHEDLGRVYHLRDTHWNANGNRVAAEEIARQLRRHPELLQ